MKRPSLPILFAAMTVARAKLRAALVMREKIAKPTEVIRATRAVIQADRAYQAAINSYEIARAKS